MKNKSLIGDNENDKIYTPMDVAKQIVDKFAFYGKVLDPFKGKGAFYDQLPDGIEKEWCETDLGRNFFDYKEHVDWIISNPPYSIFTELMLHSYEIADNIVYLIPLNKVVSSMGRVRELAAYGGIPYIFILSPKKCGFPFGFPACAVWIKKGHKGDTKVELDEE